MMSLITAKNFKPDTCPETLLMDVNRITNLQRLFQRIVMASTVMVTTKHTVVANLGNFNDLDRQVFCFIILMTPLPLLITNLKTDC